MKQNVNMAGASAISGDVVRPEQSGSVVDATIPCPQVWGVCQEMDFPTYELQEIPVTDDMEKAFGFRPIKALLGLDFVCVFDDEE